MGVGSKSMTDAKKEKKYDHAGLGYCQGEGTGLPLEKRCLEPDERDLITPLRALSQCVCAALPGGPQPQSRL